MNATRNVINKLLNIDKPHYIDNCKIENKEITQPAEIAQAFYHCFHEHRSRLILQNKYSNNKHFTDYLSEPNKNTMCFIPTNKHEILKIVKALESKKSTGYMASVLSS